MTLIRAEQIIYTRVEAEYSARLKSGFQVVYWSERLRQADIDQVERCVQCFQPPQPGAARRQFFFVESGLAVITRSLAIESDPEITDRDRRRGAFIAHCLVLTKNDLAKLDYNPLPIFDACDWVSVPRDMVERFGKATGTAPTLSLDVPLRTHHNSTNWSLGEARKLVALALAAPELTAAGRSVLLEGGPAAIDEAMEVVFALTPRVWRLRCTFDTAVDGCGIRPNQYWAVGAATRQSGVFVEVNVNGRRVVTPVEGRADESDPYLQWLAQLPAGSNIADVVGRAATMQSLVAALSRRSQWPSSGVDEDTAREYLTLSQERTEQMLAARLIPLVGQPVAVSLARYLVNWESPVLALQWTVVPHIDGWQLSALLVNWITRERPRLTDGEWRKLQGIARTNCHPLLLWLAAVLGSRADAAARDEALAEIDDRVFSQILAFLRDPVAPMHFVVSGHVHALFSDRRVHGLDERDFLELVGAVVNTKDASQLYLLAEDVGQLDNGTLTKLEVMLDQQLSVPEAFRRAMAERRQALGAPQDRLGLVNRVKGIFGTKEQ